LELGAGAYDQNPVKMRGNLGEGDQTRSWGALDAVGSDAAFVTTCTDADGGNGRSDGVDDDKAHFKYHLTCIETREALSNTVALFKDALS
jgi:hypothetical protein